MFMNVSRIPPDEKNVLLDRTSKLVSWSWINAGQVLWDPSVERIIKPLSANYSLSFIFEDSWICHKNKKEFQLLNNKFKVDYSWWLSGFVYNKTKIYTFWQLNVCFYAFLLYQIGKEASHLLFLSFKNYY